MAARTPPPSTIGRVRDVFPKLGELPDQLRGHLWRALDNGVKREEIVELITHLAFYCGWPSAGSAALIAKEVLAEHKP